VKFLKVCIRTIWFHSILMLVEIEHSHQQFLVTIQASLQKNNPDKIVDPVFGLLGNTAAAGGQGNITVRRTSLVNKLPFKLTA
jgi:hypothetical protein